MKDTMQFEKQMGGMVRRLNANLSLALFLNKKIKFFLQEVIDCMATMIITMIKIKIMMNVVAFHWLQIQ